MTEPCDVTVGGATWLDQAQETAARKNQSAGPHRRRKMGGATGELRQSIKRGGGVKRVGFQDTGQERQ